MAETTSPWVAGHCVGTHCSQEALLWENTSPELGSWWGRGSHIDLLPVGVVMVDETKMLPEVPSMNCSLFFSVLLVRDFPIVLSFKDI